MQVIDLSGTLLLLMGHSAIIGNSTEIPSNSPKDSSVYDFPEMYALSKKGTIRVYHIHVQDHDSYTELITRKKTTINGKWVEDVYTYTEGVNIGKSNETTHLQQALNEANSLINRLKDAGFTTTRPDPKAKFNTDAAGLMKPMLAHGFSERLIKFPCIGQPKYDGVRCLTFVNSKGEVEILSRKGKPYNIPHLREWAENHKDCLPLDGELYNHKELTFQEIVSAVKKHSDITSKIRYVVYDRPVADLDCRSRIDRLQRIFDEKIEKDAPLYFSEYKILKDMDDAWAYHKKCTDAGYEGIILRNMEGKYEFGFRSNDLIKLKTFDDTEFEIVDVVEATGRDAGTAIFVCKCKGGKFNVKPQGSRELRTEYFNNKKALIGKMVTVQYQGLSDDGIPRFPSAVSVRDYE